VTAKLQVLTGDSPPQAAKGARATRSARLVARGASLAGTAAAQTGIQLLALLGGLVVLRILPVREYAYYTIANAALGTMSVLTDAGIGQSILAQGGKVWLDRTALGALINTAMRLRRQIAIAVLCVWMPVLYLMLRRQGASSWSAVLTAGSLLPLFVSTLTGQVLQVVPKLHQRLGSLQWTLLSAAAMRVMFVAAAVLAMPLAWVANVCATVPQLWTNWRLRHCVEESADLTAPPDLQARATTLRQVRRTAPGALYYAFETQIMVWLISILGPTSAIAQVGALGRLALGLSVINGVVSMIWVPRFARLPDGAAMVRRFWWLQAALLLFLLMLVIVVALWPSLALLLLGKDYASLTHEVVLAVGGGAMTVLAGCTYVMASSRGVVLTPWVVLPVSLVLQAVLVYELPLRTVSGVLWIGVLTNLGYWLMHALNFARVSWRSR
jgi:hypothetical protein